MKHDQQSSPKLVVIRGESRTTLKRIGARWFKPKEVQEWFANAGIGRRLQTPSIERCTVVAKQLNVLLDFGPPPPQKWDKELTDAIKYGRLFAGKIGSQREKLAARYTDDRPTGEIARLIETMRLAEEWARRAVKDLDQPLPKFSWHDDARRIAEWAQQAWGAKAPRSRAEDDPLCEFVTIALNELHSRVAETEGREVQALTPAAVREALIGRRGGPRK